MKIAILGAGVWGKTLAKIFSARHNFSIIIWSHHNIKEEEGHNTIITSDITKVKQCDIIFITSPAQQVRTVCKKLKNIEKNITIIIGSKGIECYTLCLLSEIIEGELEHNNISILSGPNFAHEIQSGLPCAATLACKDQKLLSYLINCLNGKGFALYTSMDVIGTQIFGAVKNVIAIACGIFRGKALGNNAQAALITSGLREITDLCVAKKGSANTALELCGIGDLILTCGSSHSRNVSFGIELANGISPQDILSTHNTIEGVYTAQTVHFLAQKLGIKMPICESIYNIIYNNSSVNVEIENILSAC